MRIVHTFAGRCEFIGQAQLFITLQAGFPLPCICRSHTDSIGLLKAKTPGFAVEIIRVHSRVSSTTCYTAIYSLSSIISPFEGLPIEIPPALQEDCFAAIRLNDHARI